MITLSLPDTKAMRDALRQLAAHSVDDNAEYYEGLDASTSETKAAADAYRAFDQAVVLALDPAVVS